MFIYNIGFCRSESGRLAGRLLYEDGNSLSNANVNRESGVILVISANRPSRENSQLPLSMLLMRLILYFHFCGNLWYLYLSTKVTFPFRTGGDTGGWFCVGRKNATIWMWFELFQIFWAGVLTAKQCDVIVTSLTTVVDRATSLRRQFYVDLATSQNLIRTVLEVLRHR